jgi:hypothetical protein
MSPYRQAITGCSTPNVVTDELRLAVPGDNQSHGTSSRPYVRDSRIRFENLSTLHDEADFLGLTDVLRGIARNRHEVGRKAAFLTVFSVLID